MCLDFDVLDLTHYVPIRTLSFNMFKIIYIYISAVVVPPFLKAGFNFIRFSIVDGLIPSSFVTYKNMFLNSIIK